MTVYVALRHRRDEGADIEGVYATLESAFADFAPLTFRCVCDGYWESIVSRDEDVTIARHEVQP